MHKQNPSNPFSKNENIGEKLSEKTNGISPLDGPFRNLNTDEISDVFKAISDNQQNETDLIKDK